MAKSPLGRVEKLATEFKADKETIIRLILGEDSRLDNPWFDAERGSQPLDKVFAQRMQIIFDEHGLNFDLDYFRSWVSDAVNEPDPEMEQLLRRLKASGVRVALLTNSVPEFWPVIQKTINTEIFDCVVDSSRVGLRKPEMKIYELVAEKLGVKTTSCVMIDDLKHNIEGAKRAGMEGVLFTTSEETSSNVLRCFGL